ncbi:MAG: 50S ribosomal protein L4 [Candidatus Taylorbacteria bacterium]|nr:50S ribosomal protein L4 [Candidatus Taylorbacteria bacterium]
MESIIYNQTGKEVGKLALPESVFGLPWNADLVHQVAVSMQANLRQPVAHAKGRGEVRGGGKKPWRQKGTGRARHGSIRSPLWVGGGVTHGPTKDKVFGRKINKKMKAKALSVVLSKKLKDQEVLFLDSLAFKAPKTKEAKKVLGALSAIKGFEYIAKKNKNGLHLALPKKDAAIERSFANFNNLTFGEIRNLNVLNLLNKKYLVVVDPKPSLSLLEARV